MSLQETLTSEEQLFTVTLDEALAEVERGWPEPVAALFMKDDSYSTVAERWLRSRIATHMSQPLPAAASTDPAGAHR